MSPGLSSTRRMIRLRSGMRTILSRWQGEEKNRALTYHRIRPDGSAVALDDTLDDRQADSRSGKFRVAVQTLEGMEQLIGIRHVKTSAVVAHEVHCAGLAFLNSESHSWRAM